MSTYNCIECGILLNDKKDKNYKYCSNKCQLEYQGKQKVLNWLNGKKKPTINIVRRYLKENKGYFCEICGISDWLEKPITLEVDHIDGSWNNNHHSNFRFLCPNCHSQTDTYKGANKGKGRPKNKRTYTIHTLS